MHALEWPGLLIWTHGHAFWTSESMAGARWGERGPDQFRRLAAPLVVDADVGVLDRPAGRHDVQRTGNFGDASAPRSSFRRVSLIGHRRCAPREIDPGSSTARAWANAEPTSRQRSGVRRGGSRRPWHLRSTEVPRDGHISRSRERSALSGPSPCRSVRKHPRRPAPQRRPSRI